MTCHADKAALRNYVCTCPIEIYARSFVSVLVPRKNGTLVCFTKKKAVRKKKDFEIFGGEWRGIRNFLFSFR